MADEGPGVELVEVENFKFEARFEGSDSGPILVDEPLPVGTGAGPSPPQVLALAVGQCMSSTLVSCFERAHVQVRKVTTRVRPVMGRNPKGRLRVTSLQVEIEAIPVTEEDRPQMERCIAIFEDLCPVSGAVREGARIDVTVTTSP
jgi:uncharacterized OsmC-like protein